MLKQIGEYKTEAKQFGYILDEKYTDVFKDDDEYSVASNVIITSDLYRTVPALRYWLFPSRLKTISESSQEEVRKTKKENKKRDKEIKEIKFMKEMNDNIEVRAGVPNRTYSLSSGDNEIEEFNIHHGSHIPDGNIANRNDNLSKNNSGDSHSKTDVQKPVYPDHFYEEPDRHLKSTDIMKLHEDQEINGNVGGNWVNPPFRIFTPNNEIEKISLNINEFKNLLYFC